MIPCRKKLEFEQYGELKMERLVDFVLIILGLFGIILFFLGSIVFIGKPVAFTLMIIGALCAIPGTACGYSRLPELFKSKED